MAEAGDYLSVDGPIDATATLIEFDIPFAPSDPKKSLKLRQRMGLGAETRTVDPNVRVVIDSFITPRTWVEGGVRWVQHASPYPAPRITAVRTRAALMSRLRAIPNIKDVGICGDRSRAYAECFLEVIRQVTAECWERGLLLLKVYMEVVGGQNSHRELFESRTGYAFRLALKGEKDTMGLTAEVERLKASISSMTTEESDLRLQCDTFAAKAEEQLLIDEKQRGDEINALKREANAKKNQLEALTAPLVRQ